MVPLRSLVHVEDWREGIRADGVEGVAVLHRVLSKGLEILISDSLLENFSALRHDLRSSDLMFDEGWDNLGTNL